MQNNLRIALFLVAGCISAIVIIVLLGAIQAHPQIGIAILCGVGFLALLAFAWVIYIILNRINAQHYSMKQRELAHQADIDAHTYEQQEIQWRRQVELDERERQWKLEQRRLDLEEQKLKLAAYQAQAVQVGHNQALVIRDYSGLETRTAYEPRVRVVQEWKDTELVTDPALEQIAAPRKASALSLLHSGELDGTDLVLGVDESGQLVRKTWKQLLSVLVLGLMGGGKTNTTVWLSYQLILKGYHVALIDRHAKSEESTYARLREFRQAFDTPVGDSPSAAMRVARHVRQIFEERRDRGSVVNYKLIWVVEEFSALMRALSDKESDWREVAVFVSGLIEDLGYEGRKYGVHVIAIGQATNASRSGGTEIRDLFHTRIVHGMRERQAQNLGMTDEKKAIQKLEVGQTIIDVEGKDDPFFCQIPEVSEEFKQAVLARISGQNQGVQTPFTTGSAAVQAHPLELSNEPPVNHGLNYAEPKLPERAERVLNLKKTNAGKNAIILEVWGAKKGGSEQYKQANEEYTQMIETLVELGYLPANQ